MPRVPTQQQGIARTPFSPRDPGQTIAVGNARANVFAQAGNLASQGSQLAFEFAAAEREAHREFELAQGLASITGAVAARESEATNDPRITGSTERFRKNSGDDIKSIIEASSEDRKVRAALGSKSALLLESTAISVGKDERKRFNAEAERSMEQLAENYAIAESQASTDVAKAEIRSNFISAMGSTQFLTTDARREIIDGYEKSVSEAKVLELLREDPDLLLATIGDPALFGGLDLEERERLAGSALRVGNRRADQADKAAAQDIKAQQDDNTRDVLLALDNGADVEDVRMLVQLNSEGFSASDIGVIITAMKASRTISESPEDVIALDDAIIAGESNAVEQVKAAYAGGTINRGTYNQQIELNRRMNEPASSPTRLALKDLQSALGPDEDDEWRHRSASVVRIRKARREFLDFVSQPRTENEIFNKTNQIISAYRRGSGVTADEGGLNEGTLRAPFGSQKNVDELSGADLDNSNTMIGRAATQGLMSDDVADMLLQNNAALRGFVRTNEALKAKGANK